MAADGGGWCKAVSCVIASGLVSGGFRCLENRLRKSDPKPPSAVTQPHLLLLATLFRHVYTLVLRLCRHGLPLPLQLGPRPGGYATSWLE